MLRSDHLECTVCYSVFVEPLVLPCGHTFCKGCLASVKSKNCPLCRLPFGNLESLPKNWILWHLIEEMNTVKDTEMLCGDCHKSLQQCSCRKLQLQELPGGVLEQVLRYLGVRDVVFLQCSSWRWYKILQDPVLWRLSYLDNCNTLNLNAGFKLQPDKFNWRAASLSKNKALEALRTIQIITKTKYTNNIYFNSIPDKSAAALKLFNDEYVVQVILRQGSILDGITFITNKGRKIKGGGNGGSEVKMSGEGLIGCQVNMSNWKGDNVVSTVKLTWYSEPLNYYLHHTRVIKFGVCAHHLVNYLYFKFDNKEVQGGTKNPFYQEFNLEEKEEIKEIQTREGATIDAILVRTNVRTYGPFGGKGGTAMVPMKGDALQSLDIQAYIYSGKLRVKSIHPTWCNYNFQ
uniref:RING-type E3 ubiquitin transferase n=1 Tax=Arcella intermedia TaxID=1963864 RepID=A0A6B2L610_9EUKA